MFIDESVLSVACITDIHLGPVMGNFCSKYKLLEISRLLSHADMLTIELSTEIVLL